MRVDINLHFETAIVKVIQKFFCDTADMQDLGLGLGLELELELGLGLGFIQELIGRHRRYAGPEKELDLGLGLGLGLG